MSTQQPFVSVVMPVRNGEKYLLEAVDSILIQTHSNLELIIVNDASTDGTNELLTKLTDPRIKLLENEQQLGVARSLNKGIDSTKGTYIARMDSDDISHKERLSTQVAYLDKFPEIAVVGSWVRYANNEHSEIWRYSTSPEDVVTKILFECPIAHPTAMFRADILSDNRFRYDDTYPSAQDYELWERIAVKYKIANIGKVLLTYRRHEHAVSVAKKQQQLDCAKNVRRRALTRLGVEFSEDELQWHSELSSYIAPDNIENLRWQGGWFTRLYDANANRRLYNQNALNRILKFRWKYACKKSIEQGIGGWNDYIAPGFIRQDVGFKLSLLRWIIKMNHPV